ncbi:MAG TPA: hypothetical protein VHZ56_07685 [Devosia sp.]|nr:hypothetical protein [Devosia sp.]
MPIKSVAVKPAGRAGGRKSAPPPEIETTGPLEVAISRHQRPGIAARPTHRYHVGERLRMSNGGRSFARDEAFCKVVSLLPYEGHGSLLYRVRSDTEQFERIVIEGDLAR